MSFTWELWFLDSAIYGGYQITGRNICFSNVLPCRIQCSLDLILWIVSGEKRAIFLRFYEEPFDLGYRGLWTHRPDSLPEFLQNLNTKHSVKFTLNYSPITTFLVVGICPINTSVHIKPTDILTILTTCNHDHTKYSFPYNLARSHLLRLE